jgi:HSP20 family protein
MHDVLAARREMDQWIDRFGFAGQSLQPWVPPVSIKETESDIVVTAELPGLEPKHVEITIENGMLTISGEKVSGEEQETGTHYLNERRFGRFERSFSLLQSIVTDDIRADFANGVLTVVLPKTAEAKPKRIRIATEPQPQLSRS